MVDLGSFDIDAAISRNVAFRTASDGAHATGRYGKSDGPSAVWHYSWRRLRHVEAGNNGTNQACIKLREAAGLVWEIIANRGSDIACNRKGT